jgi:hypothetical protein
MRRNRSTAGGYGRLGILGTGDVELGNEQLVRLADGLRHGFGVAACRDHRVPCGERRFDDINAHATARTGHEPDVLVSHNISSGLLSRHATNASVKMYLSDGG